MPFPEQTGLSLFLGKVKEEWVRGATRPIVLPTAFSEPRVLRVLLTGCSEMLWDIIWCIFFKSFWRMAV